MLIIGTNNHIIKFINKIWTYEFNIKNLGVTDIILKIKIPKTSNDIVPILLF
jgi:hypothetical protein